MGMMIHRRKEKLRQASPEAKKPEKSHTIEKPTGRRGRQPKR